MKKSYAEVNWKKVQTYYETCKSAKACRDRFGYSRRLEWTAENKGDLVLNKYDFFIDVSNNLCAQCNAEISKNKKFCSSSCSAIFNNSLRVKNLKSHPCKNCNKLIKKSTQKFCSVKCSFDFKLNENKKLFNKGLLREGSSSIRKILLLKFNGCHQCKLTMWQDKPIKLELHHMDGDPSNNFPHNVKMLCPNCHSISHNWKGGNKHIFKNTRLHRSKYYAYVNGPKSPHRKKFLQK